VGYKYLSTRINRMILEMEESAGDVTDLFIRVQEGDAGAGIGPTAPAVLEAPSATPDSDGDGDSADAGDDKPDDADDDGSDDPGDESGDDDGERRG